MAMIVLVGVISCLVNSWRISHFGRKPARGGRPARDRRVSMNVAFSIGALVHEVMAVDRLRVLVVLRVRNTAVVIMVYR